MTARHLEASVRVRAGIPVIDLEGEISSLSEEALDAAYAEASRRESDAILLNFTRVGYINSTGIALIVGLLAQARESGVRLLAAGLSEHYTQIFQITRLADFITLFADEEAAVADAQTPDQP
jgi:anti-anti-sigma factor